MARCGAPEGMEGGQLPLRMEFVCVNGGRRIFFHMAKMKIQK